MNNSSYTWNPFGSSEVNTDFDLEYLKTEVGQRFPFYDVRFNPNGVAFFCRVDKEILEEKFDSLRLSLSEKGYIPMLKYKSGEQIIYIIKKGKRKEKPIWINILLLIATIITTIITGSIICAGQFDIWSMPNPIEVLKPENLLKGAFFFALPLMTILFVHEMGHYFTSKKHGINLEKSILIGDKLSDIQAGLNAKVGDLFLINTGHEIEDVKVPIECKLVNSLDEVLKMQ